MAMCCQSYCTFLIFAVFSSVMWAVSLLQTVLNWKFLKTVISISAFAVAGVISEAEGRASDIGDQSKRRWR